MSTATYSVSALESDMLSNSTLFPSSGRSLLELAAIGRSDQISDAYNNANIGTGEYSINSSDLANYLFNNSLYATIKAAQSSTTLSSAVINAAVAVIDFCSMNINLTANSSSGPLYELVQGGLLTSAQLTAILALGSQTVISYAQQTWGQDVPQGDVDSAIASLIGSNSLSAALTAIEGGLFNV
jgi:hypothetical protein